MPTPPAPSRATLRRLAIAAPCAAVALALWPAAARAQDAAGAHDVVVLAASASTEVPEDWLTVVFTARREGSDAAAVQAQLRQAVAAALVPARAVAQPGQIEVQTGGFSLAPRYAPPRPAAAAGPVIAGWQGSAELVVQGRDIAGIAALTGRIHSMSIGRVGFSLSRQARERVEAETTAQAIERFRARAAMVARQFGFGGYTLREATLSTEPSGPQPLPMPMMRAMAAPEAAEPALPVEAGKATVTVSVSGSVQLK
ncbi:MAG: SIMPL domain-containing protein [Burkholderiales bacterium]|nr:SIMPL domain-containing protein [Burkholderiales bacterium]